MRFSRRMFRILWTGHVRSNEVLRRIGTKRTLVVRNRKRIEISKYTKIERSADGRF